MPHTALPPAPPDLLRELVAIVGAAHVETDPTVLELYACDLSWAAPQAPLLRVAPASSAQLAAAVRCAGAAGLACVARGGGMSYSGGAVPQRPDTVLFDLRRMDGIVAINATDMYVTVEAGCTWQKLYQALQAQGLRMPFFGPLSGRHATVGGALAQNAFFMGSGRHGTAADSCLGLELVTADGTVLRTGSGARPAGNPFFRHTGPDLTGLLMADAGAFGIKTEATFRVLRSPAVTLCSSWDFADAGAMLAAQTELARRQLTAECFGFNPDYNLSFQHKPLSAAEAWRSAAEVWRASDSPWQGAARLLRMAAGGKRVLAHARYSLHVVIDAASAAEAAAAQAEVRRLCAPAAQALAPTLPLAFRAQPFRAMRSLMLGPAGEIWLPTHGIFPLSGAAAAVAATEQFFAEHAALMAEHGIGSSYLTFCPGMALVVEPSFYWHDALGPFRLGLIEPAFQRQWAGLPARPAARAVALQLRAALRDRYVALGACHIQLAKYYPLQPDGGNPAGAQLLAGIKHLLDPHGGMNPGALGL